MAIFIVDMGLKRGEELVIYFVVGAVLFLLVALLAMAYELIKRQIRRFQSSKTAK